MAFVSELINALDERELALVQELQLTNTELAILSDIISPSDQPSFDASSFSAGYLRKLRSGLYEKVLCAIHEPRLEQLNFFREKRLFKHLMHWVLKTEKRLLKEGDLEGLKEVYYHSARAMIASSLPDSGLSFVEEIEEKFAKNFPNDQPYFQLIKAFRLSMLTGIRREFPDKKINLDLDAEIAEMQAVAASLDHPALSLWAAFLRLDTLPEAAIEERRQIQERTSALVSKHREEISKRDLLKWTLRNMLINIEQSQHQQAYEDIGRYLEENPDVVHSMNNFSIWFCQVCIALGHYAEARTVLMRANRITEEQQDDKSDSQLNFAYVYFALINLMEGNYALAFDQIRRCQETIEKTHFFWMNAFIKLLENSYFMLVKQFDLAEKLAARNIKFYGNYVDNPDLNVLREFHAILRFCLRQRENGGELPEQYHASYRSWQGGGLAFMGGLLRKCLDIYGITPPQD